MNRFCCVLFSYNRAMQLDLTLRSLSKNMEHSDISYYVIYHCAEAHKKSYVRLIAEWERKGVVFWLRDERPRSFFEVARYLFRFDNLYWYLRYPFMRSGIDNFKDLVENAILESGAEFAFFSTDDQYLIGKTYIPEIALQRITESPKYYCYRFFTGDHFVDEYCLPEQMAVERTHYAENGHEGDIFEWNCRDRYATVLWGYRFNVDFSVFHAKTLLKFLSGLLYHMPTTLEGCGLWASRWQGYFSRGISSCIRTGIGIQANNVQKIVDNPAVNYSPDKLRDFYEAGYRMCVKHEEVDPGKFLFMPKSLYFYKEADPHCVFEFDEIDCHELV